MANLWSNVSYTDPYEQSHWDYFYNHLPGEMKNSQYAGFWPNQQNVFEKAYKNGTLESQQFGLVMPGQVVAGSNPFANAEESERRDVLSQFSRYSQDTQADIHGRGMGRSGFAAEQMGGINADEGRALANAQSHAADRLSQFNEQQAQLRAEAAANQQQYNAAMRAARKRRKMSWLGTGLGVAGLIAAPLTGGMSLPLANFGSQMFGSRY